MIMQFLLLQRNNVGWLHFKIIVMKTETICFWQITAADKNSKL
jgi:hypothetical protein